MAVLFTEEGQGMGRRNTSNSSSLTSFFMKSGLVKTARGAQYLMLGIVLLAVIGIVFSLGKGNAPLQNPQEAARMTAWMKQGRTGAPPADFMPVRTQ